MIEILLRGLLAGMFAAQFWGARRLLSGRVFLPKRPAQRVPWSLPSVVLVVLLYVTLSFVVRIGYEIVSGPTTIGRVGEPGGGGAKPGENVARKNAEGLQATSPKVPRERPSFTAMMLMVSVVNALAILTIPWLLRATSGATWEEMGLSLRNVGRELLVGGVAFLLVSPWVYAVNALALLVFPPSRHPLESMLREEFTPMVGLLAVVSGVVLAPASEELIFRGVLLGWLGGQRRGTPDVESVEQAAEVSEPDPMATESTNPWQAGPVLSPERGNGGSAREEWTAIAASALPFAIVHGTEMPAPFPIFVLAIALGYLTRRTGSLVPALTLHALFNGFSTMMLIGSIL